jgi:hypothetical protein
MSDTSGDVSVQLLNAMSDNGAGPTGTPPDAATSSPEVDVSKLSPFSQNFLAGVPEADRPVVARHMGSWDSGFTQHSQRINAQLSPYQQLGSPDEFRTIKEAFEQLKADPDGFVGQLIEMGHLKGWTRAQTQAAIDTVAGNGAGDGQSAAQAQRQMDLAQAPEIQRLQRAYGAMAQSLQQRDQAAAVAREEQIIEQQLSDAEQKYGKYNKGYVLTLMQQGLSTDAAVQAWQNEVQQAIAARSQPPRVVGSSSAPPQAAGPLNTSEDRAAALLAALQSGNL